MPALLRWRPGRDGEYPCATASSHLSPWPSSRPHSSRPSSPAVPVAFRPESTAVRFPRTARSMPALARSFGLAVRLGPARRSAAPTAARSRPSSPVENVAFLLIVAAVVCGFIFRKKIVAFVKSKVRRES